MPIGVEIPRRSTVKPHEALGSPALLDGLTNVDLHGGVGDVGPHAAEINDDNLNEMAGHQ